MVPCSPFQMLISLTLLLPLVECQPGLLGQNPGSQSEPNHLSNWQEIDTGQADQSTRQDLHPEHQAALQVQTHSHAAAPPFFPYATQWPFDQYAADVSQQQSFGSLRYLHDYHAGLPQRYPYGKQPHKVSLFEHQQGGQDHVQNTSTFVEPPDPSTWTLGPGGSSVATHSEKGSTAHLCDDQPYRDDYQIAVTGATSSSGLVENSDSSTQTKIKKNRDQRDRWNANKRQRRAKANTFISTWKDKLVPFEVYRYQKGISRYWSSDMSTSTKSEGYKRAEERMTKDPHLRNLALRGDPVALHKLALVGRPGEFPFKVVVEVDHESVKRHPDFKHPKR